MTDLAAYPDDLDECHRLLARFQAQFAVLEQKQQAWCEQERLYADLQKAHQQTTTDLLKLREDYGEVLHQLELLRRWAFGARRERVVDDPRQKHLFELDSILPPAIASPNPDESSASESEAEQEAAAKRAAARQKKRADRKLCLDALPQVHHDHDIAEEEKYARSAASKSDSLVKTSVAHSNSYRLSSMFTITIERSMAAPAGSVASRCRRCPKSQLRNVLLVRASSVL
jgi:hypothetical protein